MTPDEVQAIELWLFEIDPGVHPRRCSKAQDSALLRGELIGHPQIEANNINELQVDLCGCPIRSQLMCN